jgi:hypothetical protein
MLRNNQGAKKDLGDGKSAMKGIEDVKCVKKDIERIREDTTNASQEGKSKPSHEFFF